MNIFKFIQIVTYQKLAVKYPGKSYWLFLVDILLCFDKDIDFN